jgi:hypothetical protein
MNKHLLTCYLALSLLSTQCSLFKKSVAANAGDVVGTYINKVKVAHYKETLELQKDFTFVITTKYEWNQYEHRGTWQLRKDTLVLNSDTNRDTTGKKVFAEKLMVKANAAELISVDNPNYSLEKIK